MPYPLSTSRKSHSPKSLEADGFVRDHTPPLRGFEQEHEQAGVLLKLIDVDQRLNSIESKLNRLLSSRGYILINGLWLKP